MTRVGWRMRLSLVLIVLVGWMGLRAAPATGCQTTLFCAVEHVASNNLLAAPIAAVPAPFKFLVALVVIAFIAARRRRDPLPPSIQARMSARRRFVDPWLPRGVPWRDRFLPSISAMRDA
jgi:hypothetical protein